MFFKADDCASSADTPLEIKAALATLKTTSIITNDHVAFSKKSVVLRTPNILFDAEKFAAKPPPFGFCTDTIMVNKIEITTANDTSTLYIIICYFELFYLKIEFGLQSNYFFLDISNLIFQKFVVLLYIVSVLYKF